MEEHYAGEEYDVAASLREVHIKLDQVIEFQNKLDALLSKVGEAMDELQNNAPPMVRVMLGNLLGGK